MRRLTLIFILLFLPVVALAGKMVKVKVQKSTIFQEPNFLSSTVASVEYGAQLEMLDELKDWIHVKFEGRRGWIHKSSLTSSKFNLGTIFVGTSSSSVSHYEVAIEGVHPGGRGRLQTKPPGYELRPGRRDRELPCGG